MPHLSQLRITFVAGTLEHGGAERQLFYTLRELRKQGASVRLLSLDRGQFWEQPIRSLGVPVVCVGAQQSRLVRLARTLKALHSEPADILQSQHFFANAYVGLAARLAGSIGIGAMRNEANLEMQTNGWFGAQLHLHLPALIAANSKVSIEQVVARGVPRSRLYFLPNVVDTEQFSPDGDDCTRPMVLMASGRLVKQKRFDRMISILGRLRNELKLDVRALIVGPVHDQKLRSGLESQSARLGLTRDHLQFVDGVADMVSYYRRAAIFVLTSDYEGTPNVVLEAMACGLPVVATAVAGVPAIVQDGRTGFLKEREDLDGLVAAVARLISSASLRKQMGRQARDYIEQNHSLHRLPAYLAGLYERALPNRYPCRPGLLQRSSG